MSIRVLYLYNMASMTDELGFNENQLATLLSLLHECCLLVFDSAIITTP